MSYLGNGSKGAVSEWSVTNIRSSKNVCIYSNHDLRVTQPRNIPFRTAGPADSVRAPPQQTAARAARIMAELLRSKRSWRASSRCVLNILVYITTGRLGVPILVAFGLWLTAELVKQQLYR